MHSLMCLDTPAWVRVLAALVGSWLLFNLACGWWEGRQLRAFLEELEAERCGELRAAFWRVMVLENARQWGEALLHLKTEPDVPGVVDDLFIIPDARPPLGERPRGFRARRGDLAEIPRPIRGVRLLEPRGRCPFPPAPRWRGEERGWRHV